MAAKPTLSREYLFVPMKNMNFTIGDLSVHNMAFTDAGLAPAEQDWVEAIVVDDLHTLYDADRGPSLAVLVGPDRGDVLDPVPPDPAEGDHQVWIEAAISTSDERIVRAAGILTVSPTGS